MPMGRKVEEIYELADFKSLIKRFFFYEHEKIAKNSVKVLPLKSNLQCQ